MVWTDYSTGGTIVIIIGIVLLIAGIVILALDQSSQKVSEWWVWALIVIGVIALLVGICLFFIPSPRTLLEKHLQGHSLTELQDPDCLPSVSKARMDPVMSEYLERHHLERHPLAHTILPGQSHLYALPEHRVIDVVRAQGAHHDPCAPPSHGVTVGHTAHPELEVVQVPADPPC